MSILTSESNIKQDIGKFIAECVENLFKGETIPKTFLSPYIHSIQDMKLKDTTVPGGNHVSEGTNVIFIAKERWFPESIPGFHIREYVFDVQEKFHKGDMQFTPTFNAWIHPGSYELGITPKTRDAVYSFWGIAKNEEHLDDYFVFYNGILEALD